MSKYIYKIIIAAMISHDMKSLKLGELIFGRYDKSPSLSKDAKFCTWSPTLYKYKYIN